MTHAILGALMIAALAAGPQDRGEGDLSTQETVQAVVTDGAAGHTDHLKGCDGKKCYKDNCKSSGSIRGCYQCCLDNCNNCATTCQDGCDGSASREISIPDEDNGGAPVPGDWDNDDHMGAWLAHTDFFDEDVFTWDHANTLDAIYLDDDRSLYTVRWALAIASDRYVHADMTDEARQMVRTLILDSIDDHREKVRFLSLALIRESGLLYEPGVRMRLLEVVTDTDESDRVRQRAVDVLVNN